jgi:glycosyltransferase involved in cell wall biosynthesis
MKILYLCPDLGIPVLGRKGAAVHVREMVAAFGKAGHRVVLAAQILNKSPWEKPAEIAATVVQVRPSPAASSAVLGVKEFNELLGIDNSLPGELRRILYNKELHSELFRRFENDPPDFIYERASLYATAGATLAQSLHVPLILELNAPLAVEQETYRSTGFGALAAEAEAWTLKRATAIVAVSAELGKHVVSLGAEPGRVHVVPNGVNAELFSPGPPDPLLRAKLGLNGGPILGFVGGLRPWHGIEVLPELLQKLRSRGCNAQLLIAGDGPLRRDLEEEISRRDLAQHAIITGLVPHEQVPALIRQFYLALAPYGEQGHPFYFSPLKLFEYMACGVPVVAPELGQIGDVIRDRATGFLYRAGNLDAMISCCEQLLANPKMCAKIGDAAATEIHEHYTWDHNARKVINLVETLKANPSFAP